MKRGWESGQVVYSSLNHDFPFSAVPWKLSGSGPGERVLTCSFSSCNPKVEMPPVDVLSGVLGRRHTLLSRSQETLQVKVGV